MKAFRFMRLLYLILKFTLNYSLRFYFRRVRRVNPHKSFYGRTIYVSNHPASFMDPLIIGTYLRPIVFFLTRSDVFSKYTSWFLWSCHMLPIYREIDGVNTKSRNQETFRRSAKILKGGRNLLIFGEGFTDDVFIRRLKPVKKGAARIGFSTLEAINWSEKIYVAAIGCNYTDPNHVGSELVLSTSEKICLNDYKDAYLENPNKVISQVTRIIEQLMQEQITYIRDRKLAPFHEQAMSITRKGINPVSYNKRIPLLKRWQYSRDLAHWLNDQSEEEVASFEGLRKEMDAYFIDVSNSGLNDDLMHWKSGHSGKGILPEILWLLVLFPFALMGMIHCGIPYILIKLFVEKSFKRRVFWGSVKLILGMIIIGVINIPVIFMIYHWIYPSWWLGIVYYFSIGFLGLASYQWFRHFKRLKLKNKMKKMNLIDLLERRRLIATKIKELIPRLH